MRIDFQDITVKNFFSYGAIPTTISFKEHPLNLISGTNGRGKSALIVEAIFFALFGSPSKNIKIRSVVNDINKKNCVVDLKFKINKIDYRIIRGLNPDFIEFYKGEDKEDSRSSKKLMQKEIDEVIKLNSDTLKNICILSTNESKSFLDMKPAEARIVVENLFGIYVYSLMLQEVKNQRIEAADKIKNLERDINLYNSIVDDHKKNYLNIKKLKENFEIEKSEKLKNINDKKIILQLEETEIFKGLQYEDELLKKIFESEQKVSILNDKISKIQAVSYLILAKLKNLKKKYNTIETEDNCPICSCILTEGHKKEELNKIDVEMNMEQENIKNEKLNLENAQKEKNNISNEILHDKKELQKIDELKVKKIKNQFEQKTLLENEERIKNDTIDRHLNAVIDIEKVKSYIVKLKEMKEESEKLNMDCLYQDTIKDILSDKGIKSYIIKRDLPFLNTKINEYLRKLGFSINLEFNETFELIIDNPRKSGYDYNNFSNGQKKRIDLAILLSFIDLAKRKNSINTNLLVFDEVLDSSLDVEGINDFIEILNRKIKESNLNVFIITHKKDIVFENYNRIEIEQDGEFSYIKK